MFHVERPLCWRCEHISSRRTPAPVHPRQRKQAQQSPSTNSPRLLSQQPSAIITGRSWVLNRASLRTYLGTKFVPIDNGHTHEHAFLKHVVQVVKENFVKYGEGQETYIILNMHMSVYL